MTRSKLFPLLLMLLLALSLAACRDGAPAAENEAAASAAPLRGPGSGMMARHHATVPEPYAGLNVPAPADADALTRGAALYTQNCAVCHGEAGLGESEVGQQLNPPAAAIAHSSQMLGDDFLFWRVSEGGASEPFNSGMPAWKEVLSEDQRWDVINYVRSLGDGSAAAMGMGPGMGMGRAAAVDEAQQRMVMLDEAVVQGIVSAEEAATFATVHALVDAAAPGRQGMMGNMMDIEGSLLDELVAQGKLSAEDAATFNDVHDRLVASDLMP